MRFSLALISIAAGVAVQARPSPVSGGLVKNGAGSDKPVEARGLFDDFWKDIDGMKGTSNSPTSSSSTATSSMTSSTSSASSSPSSVSSTSPTAATPTSSVKAKLVAPAGVKTSGDDIVTTVHDAGTTRNRVGFRWQNIGSFA